MEKLSIYVVEDDESIRTMVVYALNGSGYEAQGFPGGRSFYAAVNEKKPDLVILDIMLPDEDGLEILKKLRKNTETKKIPIIMVTAKTTEIDKVKGLDSGADDYLTKPFGVMELISRVKALLRRKPEFAGNVIEYGDLTLDRDSFELAKGSHKIALGKKEFQIIFCGKSHTLKSL